MRAKALSSSRGPAPPRVGRWTFSGVLCGLALLLTGSCAQNSAMIDGLAPSAVASATTQPADPVTTKREARAAPRDAGERIDTAFAAPPPTVSKKSGDRLKPAFRPALARMLKPDVFGDPGRFQGPGTAEQAPEGGLPDIAAGPLSRFYAKLAALENGQRSEPVTILHIGDSHVAADSFTRGIRSRLQTRFGDAGRGMVIPAGVFPYAFADQVQMTRSGPWQAATSLKDKSGPYGVSGVRLVSASPSASISLTATTGAFDWAEVTVAGGSGAGSFEVSVDGSTTRFPAAKGSAATTVRVDGKGKTLKLRPLGDGRVTVLNWATGKDRPGIRYVNFGIVGATVDVTRRWDPAIVANDLKVLKPDLIIYGYGTNEGFNDNVDAKAYRDYASRFVATLRAGAPGADLMFIGAADGARRGRGKGCGSAWSTPAKLDSLRATVKDVATASSAGYWSWADAMGGRCAIDQWAAKGLAAKDRVHLTAAGYDRSAGAFVDYLTAPLDRAIPVAMSR
jgi:lysophospholipase L1-like esterase